MFLSVPWRNLAVYKIKENVLTSKAEKWCVQEASAIAFSYPWKLTSWGTVWDEWWQQVAKPNSVGSEAWEEHCVHGQLLLGCYQTALRTMCSRLTCAVLQPVLTCQCFCRSFIIRPLRQGTWKACHEVSSMVKNKTTNTEVREIWLKYHSAHLKSFIMCHYQERDEIAVH